MEKINRQFICNFSKTQKCCGTLYIIIRQMGEGFFTLCRLAVELLATRYGSLNCVIEKDKSIEGKGGGKPNQELLNLQTHSAAPCQPLGEYLRKAVNIFLSFPPKHPLLTTERQNLGLEGPLGLPQIRPFLYKQIPES